MLRWVKNVMIAIESMEMDAVVCAELRAVGLVLDLFVRKEGAVIVGMASKKKERNVMMDSLLKTEMAVRSSVKFKKDGFVERRTLELSVNARELSLPFD